MTSTMEETLSRLSPNIFTRNINYHRRTTYPYMRIYIHTHTHVQGNKHEWKVLNVSSETRVKRKHGSGFRVPMQQWTATHACTMLQRGCKRVASLENTAAYYFLLRTRWRGRKVIRKVPHKRTGAGVGICWSVGACSALLKELPRTRGSYGDDGINKYSARVAGFPVDEEIKGMRDSSREWWVSRRVSVKNGIGYDDGIKLARSPEEVRLLS